jgi:hypothetical protein
MRLVRQLAEYTITLKQLEDNLLARLAASQVRFILPAACLPAAVSYLASCAVCALGAYHLCGWHSGHSGH